jgi:hypothetical protein
MPMMQEQGVDMVEAFLRFQGEQGLADLRSLVERTAKQLTAVLADVSEEQAHSQPDPDVWPIDRAVMHTIDFSDRSYRTATLLAQGGEIEEGTAPPAAAADPPDRSLADWERLELLMHGEKTSPPPAEGLGLAQLQQRLSDVWGQALKAIDEMPAEPNLDSTHRHPSFGGLNCKEWLVLLHVHGTVHIRQIQEAKALIGLGPPKEK